VPVCVVRVCGRRAGARISNVGSGARAALGGGALAAAAGDEKQWRHGICGMRGASQQRSGFIRLLFAIVAGGMFLRINAG